MRFTGRLHRLLIASANNRASFAFAGDRPVVLDVTATYRHLADKAQEAGARIECDATFLKVIEQDNKRVACTVRFGSRTEVLSAKFVVDASGSTRAVLTSVRVAEKVTRFGVGVEYEFEDLGEHSSSAALFVGERFAPAGYGWIFPAPRQRVRVGIGLIRPDTAANPGAMLDRFLASSAPASLGLHPGALLEKHTGVIPADGLARQFVHGRVIGVGDAMCQALPLVGEGIRYCIESGLVAGNALATALHAPDSWEHHLNTYAKW